MNMQGAAGYLISRIIVQMETVARAAGDKPGLKYIEELKEIIDKGDMEAVRKKLLEFEEFNKGRRIGAEK